MTQDPLVRARALVVHDLVSTGQDVPALVDRVEDAVSARGWWVRSWPQGASSVAGQVAQDVQEALLEQHGLRWPLCPGTAGCEDAGPHELRIDPDLGPDPHWVCEDSGTAVAPLGALRPTTPGEG